MSETVRYFFGHELTYNRASFSEDLYNKARISKCLEGSKIIIVHDKGLVDKIYLTEDILLEVPLGQALSAEQIDFMGILPKIIDGISSEHIAYTVKAVKAIKELLPGIKVKNSSPSLYMISLKEDDVIASLCRNSVKYQAIETRKGKLVLGEASSPSSVSSSESSDEKPTKRSKRSKRSKKTKRSTRRKDDTSSETD